MSIFVANKKQVWYISRFCGDFFCQQTRDNFNCFIAPKGTAKHSGMHIFPIQQSSRQGKGL